jgi:DNA-binding NtrC family response regulator
VPHALIVDNDTENTVMLSQVFRECGYSPETAANLPQAREALLRHTPEIAILNEQLDGHDTLRLLESIDLTPVREIYLMSDEPSVRITPRAIRVGASDFFRKPVNRDRLARNLRDLTLELSSPAPRVSTPSGSGDVLVGESKAMQRLYRLLRKCAPGDASVFLAGESGSGKEQGKERFRLTELQCHVSRVARKRTVRTQKGQFQGRDARSSRLLPASLGRHTFSGRDHRDECGPAGEAAQGAGVQ